MPSLFRLTGKRGSSTRREADKASRRRARLGDAFVVTLAGSGRRIEVGERETVLEALETAGVRVPSNCRNGVCGTCETPVIEGAVDHRDICLTAEARECSMTVCVSRAVSNAGLTLDVEGD